MENEVIHIASALDDNFLMPTGVMLVSLFENNKTTMFHVHLFSANLTTKTIDKLHAITKKYGTQFNYYQIDKNLFNHFNINERISLASYYRIIIPEIIGTKLKKILYLDGDMIINGNIKQLWDTDLEDYIIGAIDDTVAIDTKEFKRLGIPEMYGYFNAGTLLINTEKWIANNTTCKLFNYLHENSDIIRFHDQDGLNGTLFKDRKKLSPIWNQQVGFFYCHPKFIRSIFPSISLKKIKWESKIIHFNGKEKPWHYVSRHPFKEKFRHYLWLSGLTNYPEDITLRKKLKKCAYQLLGWQRMSKFIYVKQKIRQNAAQGY